MKNKITLLLALAIILGFFSSCKTNEAPKLSKEPSQPVKQIGKTDSTTNPIYSLPEAPPAEAPPSPVPTPPPAPSLTPTPSPKPAEPNKKPAAPIPIGSYQTPLLNRDKERVDNIRLAIKKINGYKLKSGEIFSFNNVVGKRDAGNGYKVAPVIVNGEFDEDMGGGVCQLSSTILNAADRAGMQILERHSHSREVKYVPKGKDAAVNYGHLDLKFKNTTNYTVELKANLQDNKVKVYIYKAK